MPIKYRPLTDLISAKYRPLTTTDHNRPHTNQIPLNHRSHIYKILTAYRPPTTCRPHRSTYQPTTDHLSIAYRLNADRLPTTGQIPTTYEPNTSHLPMMYRLNTVCLPTTNHFSTMYRKRTDHTTTNDLFHYLPLSSLLVWSQERGWLEEQSSQTVYCTRLLQLHSLLLWPGKRKTLSANISTNV